MVQTLTIIQILSILIMIFCLCLYFLKGNISLLYISIIFAFIAIILSVYKYQYKENFDSIKKELTFQEEAAEKIGNLAFPNFLNCVIKDPNTCVRTMEVLSIRDYTDILNFAYFPLKDGVIKYNRINPDSTLRASTTNDPIIVILYYSSEMYTIIGSIGDALSSGISDPILEKYRDTLFKEVNKLFKNQNMIPNVTWTDYFKYPGPYGTIWDNKTVTWTIDIKNIDSNFNGDLKNSLYLNFKNKNYPIVTSRQQNSQFWQDNIPKQNISALSGLKELVRIQCKTIIKRYDNLLKTEENGDWDKNILKEGGENIDTYHRLRKSIRSMSRTIETFPEILDVLSMPVPVDFMNYLNTFNMDVPNTPVFSSTSNPITYKDILLSKPPKYITGYLFFVNNDNSKFFKLSKLSKQQYNSLRSLIYFKSVGTGTKSPLLFNIKNGQPNLPAFFKDTLFCPSISRTPPIKDEIATINNVPNEIYTYKSPSYSNNTFTGSYCEIDDFMGDIHDYSVLYQKNLNNLEYGNVKQLERYVKGGAKAIKDMFTDVNLPKLVKNLEDGL